MGVMGNSSCTPTPEGAGASLAALPLKGAGCLRLCHPLPGLRGNPGERGHSLHPRRCWRGAWLCMGRAVHRLPAPLRKLCLEGKGETWSFNHLGRSRGATRVYMQSQALSAFSGKGQIVTNRLCRLHGLCGNYSVLLSLCQNSHRQYIDARVWLCSNKITFIK